ncbi:TetR/AcrR family transcriptional regulator [Sporichthya polymorpha]|uniref:TetR/AcrR family transcriptional regulator n=1 Tax=Sporichthya polymorpha TaxID=35751 RepID=UPI000374A339|nr:TetR/AcrR family transcriptional regulator [Sporichthya polymorpha]
MSKKAPETVQARTGARRREATQTAIVDAMRALLLAGEPFSTLSVEQIASAAGLSRATFYLHFADKKEVMIRLAHEIVEQRFVIGAEPLADPHISRDAVNAVVTEMVDRWIDDAPLLEALIELAEQDAAVNQNWMDAVHEVGEMGAKLMSAHWGGGTGAYDDPETLGKVLAWMFERSAHQLTRDRSARDSVIAAISEVLWRVFEYRPPRGRA